MWVEKRAAIKVTKEKKNVLPRETLIEIMEWKTENTHTQIEQSDFLHSFSMGKNFTKLQYLVLKIQKYAMLHHQRPVYVCVCVCLCEMDQKSIRILENDRIKSKIFILLRRRRRHRCC